MSTQTYNDLKKKHPSLPSFKRIDDVFRIRLIDGDVTLDALMKHIKEECESLLSFFAQILQPDTHSYADMYEYNCFSQKEKDKIFALYCQAMALHRQLYICVLTPNPEESVTFIHEVLSVWKTMQCEAIIALKQLKKHWETSDRASDSITGNTYMG